MSVRVTVVDEQTGDEETRVVADGDYVLIAVAPAYLAHTETDSRPDPPSLPPDPDQLVIEVPPWEKQFMRPVDPVRAAALHEAVRLCGGRSWPTEAALVTDVLVVAKRFEGYLAGEEEAP